MALLENHLEQISLSAAAIAELPFPSPKKFTNALLRSNDITALIRDTEAHERALFKFALPEPSNNQAHQNRSRKSVAPKLKVESEHYSNATGFPRSRPQQSVVATLLGGEFVDQLRNEGVQAGKERGEVDVNLLLRGAERLSSIYPISGAKEKINSLQSRFNQLKSSIGRYESRVSEHAAQLSRMTRRDEHNDDGSPPNLEELSNTFDGSLKPDGMPITVEDLEKEEQEIQELERKKQALEERVSGMERDLGGLRR